MDSQSTCARRAQPPARRHLCLALSDKFRIPPTADAFVACSYCRLSEADAASEPGGLEIAFHEPARAIPPQQEFVMYDGEVCLGAAPVAVPGISLYELSQGLPEGYTFADSMHQDAAALRYHARG